MQTLRTLPTRLAAATLAAAVITTIAFGSCFNQTGGYSTAQRKHDFNPFPHLIAQDPDLFLFIGDNMYADLERRHRKIDLADIDTAYDELAARPGFAALFDATPILATWDDHDYGLNDAGGNLNTLTDQVTFTKQQSQLALLDFFGDPADSPRRSREGVYGSWTFGPEGKRTQVILLDTRYFRSEIDTKQVDGRRHYQPTTGPDATVLGDAQWAWLEEELKKPADLRVIASSIQIVASEHRFEKWANFPDERQRLFDLIASTGANGVVLVSGDRHQWELSADKANGPYPMYDLTSSGMNMGRERARTEPNQFRIGGEAAFHNPNFGVIRVDWDAQPATLTLEIHHARTGQPLLAYRVLLDSLTIGNPKVAVPADF
ncbi:MAG: alkaline phosphatase D family protein [Planctomycetota bacterium]